MSAPYSELFQAEADAQVSSNLKYEQCPGDPLVGSKPEIIQSIPLVSHAYATWVITGYLCAGR